MIGQLHFRFSLITLVAEQELDLEEVAEACDTEEVGGHSTPLPIFLSGTGHSGSSINQVGILEEHRIY
jgi:hypothetical protein